MGNHTGNSQDIGPAKPQPPSASFDSAVNFTLPNEGGYSNDAADAGGPTNFGITQGDLSAWLGRHASVDEVKGMSLDTAKAIYKANYWIAAFGQISQPKATAIFDWGVNYGPRSARMQAQRACNNLGCTLVDDGIIGPKTVAALNELADHAFIAEYAASIKATYEAIIAANPSQAVFRNGWFARAARIAALA